MADKGKILYDELVQDALLGVVRKVLADTAKQGLQGAHHFYIAFRTDHPGVVMPAYLRERYKDEMTIVLQNQFWDLHVADDHFSVGLSFNQKPAKLSIPFDALTGFLDPSVEFGLQFQRSKTDGKAKPAAGEPAPAVGEAGSVKKTAKGAEKALEKAGDAADPAAKSDDGPDGPQDGSNGPAKVVALDAFRKKN
jgi:hypothetical protein